MSEQVGAAEFLLDSERAPLAPALETLAQAIHYRRAQIGLGIVALLVGVTALGPFFAPHSPTVFVAVPFAHPSHAAPLGADYIGRDVLSRFLWGGRSVLVLSLLATLFGLTVGVTVGLVAAYARNWLDGLLMRGTDVILAFPGVVFFLLLASTLGPRLWIIVVAVGTAHSPGVARVARGAALEVVERDFVKAAEALGEPRRRILIAEVLPNITSPLLVEFGLRFTYSIGLIAAVSFLGFGLQPPASDWGLMINENRLGLTINPYAIIAPIAAIGLLTIGNNLFTDGIARAAAGIDRGVRE